MPNDYLGTVREFLEALRTEGLFSTPGIPAPQTRSAVPLPRPVTHFSSGDRLPLYKHFAFQLDDVLKFSCINFYLSKTRNNNLTIAQNFLQIDRD